MLGMHAVSFGALLLACALIGCSERPEESRAAPSHEPASPSAPPEASAPPSDVPSPAGQIRTPAIDPPPANVQTGAPTGGPAQPEPAAKPERPKPGLALASDSASPAKRAAASSRSVTPKRPAQPPPEQAAPPPIRYGITQGQATFLIDAPLEKIKGRWIQLGGALQVDPTDLRKAKGEIRVQLSGLKTSTFSSASQNATQTKHALTWMEVGEGAEFAQARFRIESVSAAQPQAFSRGQAAHVKLRGTLRLHGIESRKVVEAKVRFEGEPTSPAALHIETLRPMTVSLAQHDIKPRDLAGRFLSGALAQIGQKIQDTALVSIQLIAERSP